MDINTKLVLFRVGAAFVLLTSSFLFGLLPLLLLFCLPTNHKAAQNKLLSLANTFAGGLFLGTGFGVYSFFNLFILYFYFGLPLSLWPYPSFGGALTFVVATLGEALEGLKDAQGEEGRNQGHGTTLFMLALCPLGFALAFFIEKVTQPHNTGAGLSPKKKHKHATRWCFSMAITTTVTSIGHFIPQQRKPSTERRQPFTARSCGRLRKSNNLNDNCRATSAAAITTATTTNDSLSKDAMSPAPRHQICCLPPMFS